jgi:hypothetical protein
VLEESSDYAESADGKSTENKIARQAVRHSPALGMNHQAQWHRPEGYLRYVLEHIVEHLINKIDQLLPWRLGSGLDGPKLAA